MSTPPADRVRTLAGELLGELVERWLPTPLLKTSAAVHLAALALLLAAPKRWRAALGLALADHLVLLAASLTPTGQDLGPNLTRLPPADALVEGTPAVALTFDDGPDPSVTPAVLDLLDAAGVRATFFLVGRRAAAYPHLVERTAAAGHGVENHTWSHRHDFAFRGVAGLGREIDRCQEVLAGLAGRPPAWFRAPAGMRNPLLAGVLAGRGLALASWSRRSFDTVDTEPRRIAHRLTDGIAAGEVLVLHDGGCARDRYGRPVVVETLRRVLDVLEARGLACRPLPAP